MALQGPQTRINTFYGKVTSVDTKNRLLDVEWTSVNAKKSRVVPVNPPGDYSLPKPGDVGLVIGTDVSGHYYLGKVDFGYSRKLDGELDPATNKKFNVREVAAGETYLSNPNIGSWLHLANSGNISFMHPGGDGVKYTRYRQGAPLRLWQTLARTIKNSATTVTINAGSVLRNIPSVGYQLILDASGLSAQEYNVDVKLGTVDLAKFVIGNVVSKLGVLELGSFGSRVFAVLQTGLTPATQASMKFDEIGNIEINSSPTAQMSLTAQLVNLGMLLAPEPVIKGTTFQGLVNTLLGAEQTFLTAEQTFLGLLTVYYGAVEGAAATASATPGDPVKNTTAIVALGTAAAPVIAGITVYTTALTAYNTAITVYLSNLITAMSTVVKTA